MNLEVYFQGQHEALIGKVTGIQKSNLLNTTDWVDQKTLLACERPSAKKSGPAMKLTKQDFEPLLLRVQVPGQPDQFVTIKAILNRKQNIIGSNFGLTLARWRDLRYLPRFEAAPVINKEESETSDADSFEFLQRVEHVVLLDLDKEHELELYHELAADPGYLVYHSWEELTRETSPLIADFIKIENRAAEQDIQNVGIVLELSPDVVNCEALLQPDAGHASLVYHQMEFEQFEAEFPQIHHTRDSQNFYYETEPSERTTWLAYDPDSVFNAPMTNTNISYGHLNSKASRDLRFQLILRLFHSVLERCKHPQRCDVLAHWDFSPHFWMEDNAERCWLPNWELSIHLSDLTRPPQTIRRTANIYDRHGLVPQILTDQDCNGPGIRATAIHGGQWLTPGEVINSLYRQIFRTNRAWRNTREGLLTRAKVLHQSHDQEDRRQEATLLEQADHMGVFLTQSQLHQVRVLTEYYYDRFQVPQEERRQTQEKFAVSESRLNDLAEESRRIQAKLDLIMHELTLTSDLEDIRNLQNLRQRLHHQIEGNLGQQQQVLKHLLAETPASKKLREQLTQIAEQQDQQMMEQMEALADRLEQDIRKIMDPAYAAFDCNLSTAQLIFGKQGLRRRLEQLKENLEQAPDPNRALVLSNMLINLEDRLEASQSAEIAFLEDLSFRTKRQLGLEIEENGN